MNLVLMRFGIPIAIIAREDRMRYYDTLEQAQGSDLSGFVALLRECVEESLEEWEEAAKEQKARERKIKSLREKMGEKERIKSANQFEIWQSAMDLLMGYIQQFAKDMSDDPTTQIRFREFGELDFEKYLFLKKRVSAKRTWFFRTFFESGDRKAGYLFFFGFPSRVLREHCDVTLWVSREEPAGSFHYERLDYIHTPNVPDLREIGYSAKGEYFIARYWKDQTRVEKIDRIGTSFFEDVIQKHFHN